MRVCVFEDRGVGCLEPLSLTRPAFELWCGTTPLLDRQCRHFNADETGALVRPPLVELCRLNHAEMATNDLQWLRASTTVMVNARWIPPAGSHSADEAPHVALCGEQVAYAVLPPDRLTYCSPNTLDDCVETWKRTLPTRPVGGWMVDYPWDLVEHNAELLKEACSPTPTSEDRGYRPANLTVVGPSDLVFAHPSAQIEPLAVVDTTRGPVIIDRDAVVRSFSRLEGPCYIGPKSQILGAKVRSATIGPQCRIGGEVEACIFQGFSNKYHDGFLGHSYVGEWVNLAAGTQSSDLRNDYGPVTVTINGRRVDTGLTKVGCFIGDHTKTGLGTLLNTGTVVGAFCSLLPAGELLPRVIPSFCTHTRGQIVEEMDLGRTVTTVGRVMRRRGCEPTTLHASFIRWLHDHTASQRGQVVHERDHRRLRLSA